METGDDSGIENDYEQSLVDMCRDAETSIFRNYIGRLTCEAFCELRMTIDLGNGESIFGTSDKIYVRGSLCVQIDYKFGRISVEEPPNNWQAKAYVLGTFQRFPKVQKVIFFFLQPQTNEVSMGEFTRADMPRIQQEISEIIARARLSREHRAESRPIPLELINPTPEVCDYCQHVGTCPKVTGLAAQIHQLYKGDDEEQALVHGSQIEDPHTLAMHLDWAPVLEAWAKGIRRKATEEASIGREIPGYTLKSRTGRRTIDDARLAAKLAAENYGVPEEEFLKVCTTTWTGATNLISKHAPRGEKGKRKEAFEAELFEGGGLSYGKETAILTKTK